MDYGYYKKIARESLAGKWSTVAIGTLIYFAANSICSVPSVITSFYEITAEIGIDMPGFISSVYTFFANSPLNSVTGLLSTFAIPVLAFGLYSIGYKAINRQKIEITAIFDGFRNFGNVFILNLLISIFTFLWTLLFIIPGIIKGLSYSMANFIMAENPDIKPSDAIKESKKLMDGNKFDYFLLSLSFIGWYILEFFTLGILSVWLMPYIYTTEAAFYEAVKNEKYGDAAPYVYKNMLYKQIENGYFDSQQGGMPYGENPAGYPYQQGAMPYGQPQGGYTPNQQTYSPQGFISDEYGNPIPQPEAPTASEPIVPGENSDNLNA